MVADGPKGCFVHDIGQFGAGSAGSHTGHFVVVDIGIVLDFLGMHLEDGFTALEVRQAYRHLPVETARSGEGGIQGFGTVGGCQNDDACIVFESVHFREQLVQGLFSFIVSADSGAAALLADGIDFIDEHDAGCLFLGLLEEVSHLGGAHAYEHFHKFRA